MKECFQWLISSPKIPPRQWETYRREEIEHYIAEMRSGIVGRFMPEWTYYQGYRRRAMKYTGDMDYRKQREGRGVCLWPDPPYGGGGSSLPTSRHGGNGLQTSPPLLPRCCGERVSNRVLDHGRELLRAVAGKPAKRSRPFSVVQRRHVLRGVVRGQDARLRGLFPPSQGVVQKHTANAPRWTRVAHTRQFRARRAVDVCSVCVAGVPIRPDRALRWGQVTACPITPLVSPCFIPGFPHHLSSASAA